MSWVFLWSEKMPLPTPDELTDPNATNAQMKQRLGQLAENAASLTLVEESKIQSIEYTDSEILQLIEKIFSTYLRKFTPELNDVLIAFTDKIGNRTWLEANSNDGGLTRLSKKHVFNALNARFNLTQTAEYFFALTDAGNRLTDMSLNNKGQIADFVIERWRKRINAKNSLNINTIQNDDYFLAYSDKSGLVTDLALKKNGQFADFVVARLKKRMNVASALPFSDLNKISFWGSSTFEYMNDELSKIAQDLNFNQVYLGGKGGEQIEQISARMGAHPANLSIASGKIPASGSVEVSVDWVTNINLQTYSGVLNGIAGTLAYDATSSTKHIFTRSSAGSEVTVTGSKPFIPDTQNYRDSVCVINAGKNNLISTISSINSAQRVFDRTIEMYDYLKPHFKCVIVVGHFVSSNQVGDSITRVLDCNTLLKNRFGELYYDLQAYLMSPQVWIDTNITPTQTDLDQQAAGLKPTSLSKDNNHMNTAANIAFANQLKSMLSLFKFHQ